MQIRFRNHSRKRHTHQSITLYLFKILIFIDPIVHRMMVSLGCNVRVHTTPKLERMPRVFSSLEKAVHPIPGNHMLSKYHGVSHRGPVYRVRQHRANSRLTVKSSATDSNVPEGSVSIVLLAGGVPGIEGQAHCNV